LASGLTKQQAEQIYALGKKRVVFTLFKFSKVIAEQKLNDLPVVIAPDLSTPLAQKPELAKPNNHNSEYRTKPVRKKAIKGFAANSLKKYSGSRECYVKDIPDKVQIETVRYVIHRDWCPNCRKAVGPVIAEMLPKAFVGNGFLVLRAWLHYNNLLTS